MCVSLSWQQAGAHKLLKSGRSRVLLVSMATTLGTRALMTDDLEPQRGDHRHDDVDNNDNNINNTFD